MLSGRRGVALAYVLVLLLSLSGFLGAAVLRYHQTARFMSFGADTVRARMLADSGAKLAIILMRDKNPAWYEDGYGSPVTSESLGYSEQELSGRFELEFDSLEGINESPGTYVTVLCTGISGRERARTAATVKLTTPITNFVFFSNGNYNIPGWGDPVIRGPIFVNSNGDLGNVSMWHDNRYIDNLTNEERHVGRTITLDAQIKSAGNIYVRNPDHRRDWSQEPMLFDGTVPAGNLSHDDLAGTSTVGKLNLEGEFVTQPNVPLNVTVPDMRDVMNSFSSRGDVVEVDVSDFGNGVLAEFIDGELVISEVNLKDVGRVFDKDVYTQARSALIAQAAEHYENADATAMDKLLQDETVYDDPLLENAPYPPALQNDINGDGVVESEGDSIPVRRITRGRELQRVSLSDDNFTSVRLTTNRFDHAGIDGETLAPPVFVRGVVDGKASLAYDVEDEGMASQADKLRVMLLADHEHPDDSAQDIASGPGVPGGLRYADPDIPTTADSDIGSASKDQLILLSRGTFSQGGTTTYHKQRVWSDDGQEVNYKAFLDQLVDDHHDYYGSLGYSRADFVTGSGGSNAVAHGVFVAGESTNNHLALTTLGIPEKRGAARPWSGMYWSSLPGPIPLGAQSGKIPLLLRRMRSTMANHGTRLELTGAVSSLDKRLNVTGGVSQYDYRLQAADADVIANEMGLPVSAVVCTWQRL